MAREGRETTTTRAGLGLAGRGLASRGLAQESVTEDPQDSHSLGPNFAPAAPVQRVVRRAATDTTSTCADLFVFAAIEHDHCVLHH